MMMIYILVKIKLNNNIWKISTLKKSSSSKLYMFQRWEAAEKRFIRAAVKLELNLNCFVN
jgi:hypothetical protein